MTPYLTSALALAAVALTGCTSQQATAQLSESDTAEMSERKDAIMGALSAYDGVYDVSDRALATAIRGEDGEPVGLLAYESPVDAVKAGDIAAFVAAMKNTMMRRDDEQPFASAIVSIDTAAGGDHAGAIELVQTAVDSDDMTLLGGFLEAWYLALDGRYDEAIDTHRSVGSRLPGLTGDLSLAALLEVADRPREALAVYSAITPSRIEAPEHDFDPQSILYGHVKLVIARQAILLRQMGEIEEAKSLYTRLAEAEPEKAASFAAALNQIETGRGLEEAPLKANEAFARSLTDYSLSLSYQRLIRSAFSGQRATGFDDTKAAFDQLALLIDPGNDDIRLAAVSDLYDQTFFDAAIHVASVAPEQTAALKLAQAQSLVRLSRTDDARKALDRAIALAEDDEELGTYSSAMLVYALLEDRNKAFELAEQTPDLAETDAEKASAHSTSATIYRQFGQSEDALIHARAARQFDDTHDRRMALANALADVDQIDEALQLIRTEALGRPNDPYMLNTLGYFLLENTDNHAEAYRVLARANALAPNDPYISDSFGWARYRLGDLEGARRYIEQSRKELEPNAHWEIEDHLGDIYWHLDRKDEAREAWQAALDDYPNEEKRAEIEAKLESGLSGPPPEEQPLPNVSLGDDNEVNRQDI
jgi:tetratricopeptide (TPR) repeat protein